MISLAEARALIQANIRPLAMQTVPLPDAQGRVLREAVHAREDMPAFDRSAMDGYAVALDDDSKQFHVVGEIQPGKALRFKIKPGEAARIFTGAQIPGGASQVIVQEQVRIEGNFITPVQRNRATNIRKRGEDAHKGDLLLHAGTQLGAGELALLASLGAVSPKISPPVRVAHFATGNELVNPSREPEPGQIRDSNSTLVAAFVRTFSGDLVKQEHVADDFDSLLEAVAGRPRNPGTQSPEFDLLLISGGASVGDYDFGKKLLCALGFTIHFERINLRPGRPLVFATRENQAAFILPGNPVSHFVTLHVAVLMALELFSAATPSWSPIKMPLADAIDYRPNKRETLWPARVTIENGGLVAHALRWQSSGDVNGLAGANALLQFTGEPQSSSAGSLVNTLLLDVP